MSSFALTSDFIQQFVDAPVKWGFEDCAGNSFGEIVFCDKYSRVKEDGSKERWYEVCERVTNGTYSVQKDHAKSMRLPWNDNKAQTSAREFFTRMFEFKWLPPGRGLWMMGTPLVMEDRNSAALQNCAFVSTADMTYRNPAEPFAFLMEASMLGVGVGFDTLGAKKDFRIFQPDMLRTVTHNVSDSREGWVKSVELLINSYLKPNMEELWFVYDDIRAKGEPIKRFGGTAAGPEPLMRLHNYIIEQFSGRLGQKLTTTDIVDLQNMIGQCVVAGNVRRSAELAMGEAEDKDFLELKNWNLNPRRMHYCTDSCKVEMDSCPGPGWGGLSNNSVSVTVGTDYTPYLEGIALNGEPGLIWMDVSRAYGRLVDPPTNVDHRAMGYNPCFHPDTLIETVDGPKRIADITEPTLVYTKGADGKLTARKSSASWVSRRNARTLRIELQNGDELIVTPEHKIMRRDGSWVEAKDLRPNDSLEVLCRARRGWRYSGVRLASQSPSEQVMEHRMIWEAAYGPIPEGYDIDHINRDHQDNRIDNLQILSHSEHACLSRGQVPNDHQVHAENGDFASSGLHGAKPREGAINPRRATNWTNQFTVRSIGEGPVTDVYDLTVDDTHCMIANGVVAHNCAEQTLESYEMCTLVETFISRHENLEDYKRTLKFAYLYAKTVTLLATHWEKTNAIMQRNRRIGCSISGIAEFADKRGITELRHWMEAGFDTVKYYDTIYSEWLCVRTSNKMTSIKPSGTVSQLAGVTPGVHWMPGGEYFLRALRLSSSNPLVPMLKAANYTVEPDVTDPSNTMVAYFPIHSNAARSQNDVTMWEKANLAMVAQRYWADNSVSVTISFDPVTEASQIGNLLNVVEGQVKTLSFLPLDKNSYPQMPYTEISAEQYDEYAMKLLPISMDLLYDPQYAVAPLGEEFCTTDVCEVPRGS